MNMVTHMPAMRLRDPIRNLLETFFQDTLPEVPADAVAPRTNITETEQGYALSFELPGVAPEDIDVQVKERQLTLTAERREEQPKNGTTFHRVELRYGRFTRSILLPEAANADDVQATFDKGILTVTVGKRPESKPVRVQVKTS
jgi:HSP20 family protein